MDTTAMTGMMEVGMEDMTEAGMEEMMGAEMMGEEMMGEEETRLRSQTRNPNSWTAESKPNPRLSQQLSDSLELASLQTDLGPHVKIGH